MIHVTLMYHLRPIFKLRKYKTVNCKFITSGDTTPVALLHFQLYIILLVDLTKKALHQTHLKMTHFCLSSNRKCRSQSSLAHPAYVIVTLGKALREPHGDDITTIWTLHNRRRKLLCGKHHPHEDSEVPFNNNNNLDHWFI